MADYTRDQLYNALRKADAAGDTEAAKAITARIKEMNPAPQGEGLTGNVSYDPQDPTSPPLDSGVTAQDVATGLQSSAAGAAQGVAQIVDFPMTLGTLAQRGINQVVGAGGGALLDLLGFDNAAANFRADTDRLDARLANTPTLAGMIEQASPTPQGMEGSRFASQLIGGMAVPFGPKAPFKPGVVLPGSQTAKTAAQQVVDAGAQNGVRVMTSDVRPPQTFMSRMMQNVGERIPIAGTGGPRAAQQAERVNAMKRVGEDYGAEVGGNHIDDVAKDLATTRGAKLTKLTKQKDAVIDGTQGAVQAPRAIAAIDQQVARLQGLNNDAVRPVINTLEKFKQTLSSGLSLRNVEENRKILGEAFKADNLAEIRGIGEKAVRAIYAPLRDDMGQHIKDVAGTGAFDKWSKANAQLSEMAGELSVGTFKRVLADAETTPENVAKLLFSAKRSDVRRLMGNLSPEGRAKAQAAVIERALAKAGDSPDKFANELTRMGQQIGVVFEGQDLSRIQGLERLLQATKRASQASVTPPTGVQNTPIVGGYAAGSLLGSAAIPYAALVGLSARAYESATVRNLLLGLSKSKPGSPGESKILERLGKVIVSQGEIQLSNLSRAANDTITPGLAASEGNQN